MPDSLPENLNALLAEFSRSEARELHVRRGDVEVYLSKDGKAKPAGAPRQPSPAPAIAPSRPAVASTPAAAPPTRTELPADAIVIAAPNLGTFYRAPKPGAANYVEVGSTIAGGDEVCLIEVMKLFTAVRAEVGGRIHAVLAEDGAMVEAGQPLFAVVKA